ncbi:acyl-CoA dehydrogenase family protein [Persicitalea sp.]|uniref:acyl-CoA dehydrogenase n=1 Tax=Persicitalea sp. TaxID=3100273 RepID=UPI0035942126
MTATKTFLSEVEELVARFDNFKTQTTDTDFPHETFSVIRNEGLLALPLLAEYDPLQAADYASAQVAFHRLLLLLKVVGRGSLPAGRIYEGHANALHLIQLYGTSQQKRYWAECATEQQQLFGIWNTESQDGIKVHQISDDEYEIEGSKTFCSGAGQVDQMIITGHLLSGAENLGWQMVVVPLEKVAEERIDPSFWQPMGMTASASYKVDYTGIRLKKSDLLGQPNDYHQQPAFSGGAVRFAAVHLGGAEALFEHVRRQLKARERVDHPYQLHRLGQLAIAVEGGNQWLNGAAANTLYAYNSEQQVMEYANMVRTAITGLCQEVIQLTLSSVGVQGCMKPNPLERIIRDLQTYLCQPNPDGALAAAGKYVGDAPQPLSQLWRKRLDDA